MAAVLNTFEGGTNGVTISTGNSGGGSGDAFNAVSIGASATAVYSSSVFYRGALGATLTTPVGATTVYLEYSTAVGVSAAPAYGRLRLMLPVLPAADTRVALITDNASTFLAEFRIDSTGKLEMRNGATALISETTAVVTAGVWFDIAVAILVSSATVGQIEAKLFLDPVSNTATETLTSSANQNTLQGGGTSRLRAGINRSVASFTTHLDDVQWSSTGYPNAAVDPSVVALTPATASFSAVAVTAIPGAVTVSLTPAAATLAAVAVTPVPGPVTVALTPASATLAGVAVSASPGAVTVALTTATAAWTAVALDAFPGAVTVELTPATAALTAVEVTPTGSADAAARATSAALVSAGRTSAGTVSPANPSAALVTARRTSSSSVEG